MAKKKKSDETPEAASEEVQDAVEESVTEAPEETETPEDDAQPEQVEAEAEEASDVADAAEAPVEDAPAEEAPEPVEETAEETIAPLPAPQPEPVVIRKGGFFPMLLGGIAAAVIGFGAARYVLPEGWPWPGAGDDAFETEVTGKLDQQAEAIAALEAREPDLSPIENHLGGLQDAVDTLAGRVDSAAARLDGFEARLTDLEKRPITEGASPAAVAAYERELKALQEAMAAQRAEIEQLAKEAAAKEASAEMTAQEAAQRAAVTRILTALDTGTGFADAAADLGALGVSLPGELSAVAQDGVDSIADLADAFPEAARAALAVARKDEQGGGFGAFLKNQLGARSLEPREGDDADAVLSRVEAAVKEGRLTDAMAELETLPEDARAEMSGWLARAEARAKAVAAAEALSADLNSN
ncbi:COG4223 family protein [Marimonas lutisalis]|uniref:COG4223 family protein n=1 Tax=Marimonas lutisalis TaxID=2545756 RepID=UPI0010F506CA|nr:hypothetical protein [Marimonas lutisalis]